MNRLRGLYLHVPFCSVKCFYCDFTAFAGQRASVKRYLEAMRGEALARPRLPIDTLYVGGGTPSELSVDELGELLRIVESCYRRIRDLLESTVEANPESLTTDKLELLARKGVSRISIGLQTLEPRLLKEIGRRHTVEEFFRAYSAAKALGFSLNVDLMSGLPTQTFDEAVSSLTRLINLEPDHISLYGLSVEDRTLFAKRGVYVDEDLDRAIFERSLELLAAAGYEHYEISNFAKPRKRSRHNQIYWTNGEYIGLGCGASGYLDGVRYANKDRLGDYCSAVEAGWLPQETSERLESKERLGEIILLGLRRMEGMELTPEMDSMFSRELACIGRQGWVERNGSRVRLTDEGVFLANKVFEEFVAPFGEGAEEVNL